MRINTFITLLLVVASANAFRNWPHPGFDPQHSRFQADPDLHIPLCGATQNRNPFSTTATQTVVFDGVQYYSKSGTASIFAFNLTVGSTSWRITDVVTNVLNDTTKTGGNLTSPIFVAIVTDPPHDHYLFTYFTLGKGPKNTNEKVVALLNLMTGEVAFKTNKTTGRAESEALGVTIHYDLSFALLTSAEYLSALPLPFNNATREAFDTFTTTWDKELNATIVQTPLVLDATRLAFLYPSDSLSILKAATGDTEYTVPPFSSPSKLVFSLGDTIALTQEGGGLLVHYSTRNVVTLPDIYPLAVASNETDYIAFREVPGDDNQLVKESVEGKNTTILARLTNITGPVAASVDWKGVVYVIGSGGDYPLQAFSLTHGTFLWKLTIPTNESNIASPIIASSGVNDTYLFVDSPDGQYSFSPSCAGDCNVENNFCSCHSGTYGASCSVACSTNSTCNGQGSCNYAGSCVCFPNYYPEGDCSVRCKQNLDCFNGTCQGDGTCACKTDYYSMKCNQFCDNETCSDAGTCDVDGNCSCIPGGWFDTQVHSGPHCLLGANYALIGIIIAIIGLGGMCIGLCLCCFCEKSRKELPKNPSKLSLLKHQH